MFSPVGILAEFGLGRVLTTSGTEDLALSVIITCLYVFTLDIYYSEPAVMASAYNRFPVLPS